MSNRFTNIVIAMVAAAMLHEAVAKEAANHPYVQSGPDGVFYARCIPAAATGAAGSTEIYKIQKDRDERVDRYDWYTKHGVVLGWSPIAGKVAVLAIRPQPSDSLDKQVELGFYLGGKLLKSWTTAQLQSLGADEGVEKPGGRHAMFQVLGCEQIPGTNEYVFTIQIANKKKLSFDILTGDLYVDDSAKNPSKSVDPLQRAEHAPYEIVLNGENVVFDKAETVSSQIVIRDLGVKKMIAPDLYWGLSVVWDGKEYKRDPNKRAWNGPWEIIPKTVWSTGFSLSEYLVPTEVLTAGRHTIALKDAFAESNALTVFLKKTSVREAAWGEPVEGVSARLRADKTSWTTNETPTFKLEVRNQGQRRFSTVQSQVTGRLEVDGVWYGWTGPIDLKGSWPLPPGREYHDIPVSLGSDWKATKEWSDKTQAPPPQIPLKLLPGKHTIRFAPEIRDITAKPKPQINYVPSNPVEIEIKLK